MHVSSSSEEEEEAPKAAPEPAKKDDGVRWLIMFFFYFILFFFYIYVLNNVTKINNALWLVSVVLLTHFIFYQLITISNSYATEILILLTFIMFFPLGFLDLCRKSQPPM